MTTIDWSAVILAALGLGTAIVRAVSRRRSAAQAPAPTTSPAKPTQPVPMPPAPPGRTDAAITAAEHEKARQEAARRSPAPQPAPAADLTKPATPNDNAIESRDMQ
jgi:hypothetical protein